MGFVFADGEMAIWDFIRDITCHGNGCQIVGCAVPEIDRDFDIRQLEPPGTPSKGGHPRPGRAGRVGRLPLRFRGRPPGLQAGGSGYHRQGGGDRFRDPWLRLDCPLCDGRLSISVMPEWPGNVFSKRETSFVQAGHAQGGPGCIQRPCAGERRRGSGPVPGEHRRRPLRTVRRRSGRPQRI